MSKSKSHETGRADAVRVMVDELRAEPTPELPWEAMEARLLARVAEREQREARSAATRLMGSPLKRVFGIMAVAAAIALGLGSAASLTGDLPSTAGTLGRHPIDLASTGFIGSAHDLRALRPGDVVASSDAALTFETPGLVRWTLAPNSSLRVLSVGLGHTVELERGSLRAEVTPRDPSEGMIEAFAVEIEGTRVAVHGTAFTVMRDGEHGRVLVDVEHGAVAVGPRGNAGVTTGHLLVGPSRGSFSLDGGRVAQMMDPAGDPIWREARTVSDTGRPPSESVAAAPVAEVPMIAAPVAVAGAAVTSGSAKPAADAANAADGARAGSTVNAATVASVASVASVKGPRLTADVVRGRVEQCLRAAFATAPSTLESMSSTLTIDVNGDGSVRAARFDPPLNPELTACASSAIAGRFADDAARLEIPVSVHR